MITYSYQVLSSLGHIQLVTWTCFTTNGLYLEDLYPYTAELYPVSIASLETASIMKPPLTLIITKVLCYFTPPF
jgi:hypothetical protein